MVKKKPKPQELTHKLDIQENMLIKKKKLQEASLNNILHSDKLKKNDCITQILPFHYEILRQT